MVNGESGIRFAAEDKDRQTPLATVRIVVLGIDAWMPHEVDGSKVCTERASSKQHSKAISDAESSNVPAVPCCELQVWWKSGRLEGWKAGCGRSKDNRRPRLGQRRLGPWQLSRVP